MSSHPAWLSGQESKAELASFAEEFNIPLQSASGAGFWTTDLSGAAVEAVMRVVHRPRGEADSWKEAIGRELKMDELTSSVILNEAGAAGLAGRTGSPTPEQLEILAHSFAQAGETECFVWDLFGRNLVAVADVRAMPRIRFEDDPPPLWWSIRNRWLIAMHLDTASTYVLGTARLVGELASICTAAGLEIVVGDRVSVVDDWTIDYLTDL